MSLQPPSSSTQPLQKLDGPTFGKELSPVPKLIIIPILGPPAAGKGTICRLIVRDADEKQPIVHLSVGDMLRARTENTGPTKTPDIAALEKCLKSAELVPAQTLIPLLRAELETIRSAKSRAGNKDVRSILILLDGFPRSLEQALFFEEHVQGFKYLLELDCDEAIAKNRYLTRRLSGREDDNEPLFRKRYEQHVIKNAELLKHYGDKVHTVKSTSDEDSTYAAIRNSLSDSGIGPQRTGAFFYDE